MRSLFFISSLIVTTFLLRLKTHPQCYQFQVRNEKGNKSSAGLNQKKDLQGVTLIPYCQPVDYCVSPGLL